MLTSVVRPIFFARPGPLRLLPRRRSSDQPSLSGIEAVDLIENHGFLQMKLLTQFVIGGDGRCSTTKRWQQQGSAIESGPTWIEPKVEA